MHLVHRLQPDVFIAVYILSNWALKWKSRQFFRNILMQFLQTYTLQYSAHLVIVFRQSRLALRIANHR